LDKGKNKEIKLPFFLKKKQYTVQKKLLAGWKI